MRLMISPGASVTEGQPVMELETDKAVVEVPSSVSGTVKEIRVKEGEKIKVGQVIFTVENGAGAKAGCRSQSRRRRKPPQPKASAARSGCAAGADSLQRNNCSPSSIGRQLLLRAVPSAAGEPSEFKLPELGENIDQGDLVRLMISPGAKVSEGQPVMELETDKAVVEVPSSVTGIVKEIKVKEGEKIKVGQVIFTLEGGASAQPDKRKSTLRVEHVSEQHEARLAFQAAIAGRGKNCGAGISAGSAASRAPPAFAHAGATGQGRRDGASRSPFPLRRTSAVWRAKSASTFMT